MGPPWLDLLHYNLHERREGKRVSSPDLEGRTSWHPHCPIPEMSRDRGSLFYSWCPQVICCHTLVFSLEWVPYLTYPRLVFNQDGNCGDHVEQRERKSVTLTNRLPCAWDSDG